MLTLLNKKKHFLIILLFLSIYSCNAQNQRVYYDKYWNITTKDNASFYRVKLKKVDTGWLIQDYYITGELQFKGISLDSIKEIWHGDAVWYYPNGRVVNKIRYKNGETTGYFIGLEGTNSSEKGFLESELHFNENQALTKAAVNAVANAETGYIYNIYYKNSTQIAIESNDLDFSNTVYRIFYTKTGDTIGKVIEDINTKKLEGTNVEFYKEKDACISVSKINTFKNGAITNAQVFNRDETLLTEGTYKDSIPYQGSFYNDLKCDLYSIKNVKKGKTTKEAYYKDKKLGELFFKNGKIKHGTAYSCNHMANYKNGVISNFTLYELNLEEDLNYYYECEVVLKSKKPYISNIKKYEMEEEAFLNPKNSLKLIDYTKDYELQGFTVIESKMQ